MECSNQSQSESEYGSTCGTESDREEQEHQKTAKFKQRKSTISRKKIKDRFFCIIFCRFNDVRNT